MQSDRKKNIPRSEDLVPVSLKELESNMIPVYETSDFEFVAFAKAYNNPPTDLINARRISDPDAVDVNKSMKLVFQLAGPNGENIIEQLRDLALKFMNGSTVIEPKRLLAERKWLRGWMLDARKLQSGKATAHRLRDMGD